MLSSTSLLLLGLSLTSQTAALPKPGAPEENWPGWSGIRHLFSFGNSYTQTGFEVTGEQPSDSNPMGNPAYPGYTSSNGPNWIGFLTTTHNASTVLSYNLAYGGATVDSALVEPYEPTVKSLKDQVETEFLPTYGSPDSSSTDADADAPPVDWTSTDSLFAFFIGINDIGNTYWEQNTTLHGAIFSVYADLVDQLYAVGARNFLFLNVPPIERAPLTVQEGEEAMELEAKMVRDFNGRVDAMAEGLRTDYSGTYVRVFDYHTLMGEVMDEPSVYVETSVYRNTTGYCEEYQDGTDDWYTFIPSCGVAVNEYLWLNDLHPTFPINNATAREIVGVLDGNQTVPL